VLKSDKNCFFHDFLGKNWAFFSCFCCYNSSAIASTTSTVFYGFQVIFQEKQGYFVKKRIFVVFL
jgi:hypothetical protein